MINRKPKYQAERFNALAGTVVDVIALLDNLSRSTPLERTDNKRSLKAAEAAMKVSVHALWEVVQDLNDEQLHWEMVHNTELCEKETL